MKENYASEITEPSLRELEELAKWYNEKMGNHPVIVGGWAVYFYTGGLGSKDIDVVFPDAKVMHQTLLAYFLSHGYTERSRSFFDKEFVKLLKIGGREIEIIVDAVSAKRVIIFDGKNARLPWEWAMKHVVEHKVGEASVCIPTIELLLAYKFGAILGRNINLKTGLDFNYYRSKLWKDIYDVTSLCKLEMDARKVGKFLADSGLHEYRDEIMHIIADNFDAEMAALLKGEDLSKVRKILSK